MIVLKIEIATAIINILSSFMVTLSEHGFIWEANWVDRMTTNVIRQTCQVIINSDKSE